VRRPTTDSDDRLSWNGGPPRSLQRRPLVDIAEAFSECPAVDGELGEKEPLRLDASRFGSGARCHSSHLWGVRQRRVSRALHHSRRWAYLAWWNAAAGMVCGSHDAEHQRYAVDVGILHRSSPVRPLNLPLGIPCDLPEVPVWIQEVPRVSAIKSFPRSLHHCRAGFLRLGHHRINFR